MFDQAERMRLYRLLVELAETTQLFSRRETTTAVLAEWRQKYEEIGAAFAEIEALHQKSREDLGHE